MQKERQQQLENELAQEKLHCLEVCVASFKGDPANRKIRSSSVLLLV